MVADHAMCINTQSGISQGVFDKFEGGANGVLGPHFFHCLAPLDRLYRHD